MWKRDTVIGSFGLFLRLTVTQSIMGRPKGEGELLQSKADKKQPRWVVRKRRGCTTSHVCMGNTGGMSRLRGSNLSPINAECSIMEPTITQQQCMECAFRGLFGMFMHRTQTGNRRMLSNQCGYISMRNSCSMFKGKSRNAGRYICVTSGRLSVGAVLVAKQDGIQVQTLPTLFVRSNPHQGTPGRPRIRN